MKKKKKEEAVETTELTDAEEGEGGSLGSTLIQHMLELRKCLMIAAIAVLVCFLAVFELAIDPVMAWITEPIVTRGIQVIYTAVSEALVTKFKVAIIGGVILASPVVFWEIWSFVRPALYEHEKKLVRVLFFVTLTLFLIGVAFAYFGIYNLALTFFIVSGDNLATPMLSLDKYVGFLFGFLIPFGVAFELPVVIWLTTKMGWTNKNTLASKRKFVLLGIFVFAAILTPPDVVSQVALGVPLYLLYEVSIIISRFVKPRDAAIYEEEES